MNHKTVWVKPGCFSIQGDPGDGKTTFVLKIAAKLSKGEGIDSEMKLTKPLNVIYQSVEDGLADTVKPRLEQAGAKRINNTRYWELGKRR